MKKIILFISFVILFSNTTQAYDNSCPRSSEINYRASVALGNLELIEDEVHFFRRNRAVFMREIEGAKRFFYNLLQITQSSYATCRTIQSNFYHVDHNIRGLRILITRRLQRNPYSPILVPWDSFIRSYIELQVAVAGSDNGSVRRGRVIRGSRTRVIRPRRPRRGDRFDRSNRRNRRHERRYRRENRRRHYRNPNPNPNPNRNPNPNPRGNEESNSSDNENSSRRRRS